MIHKSHMESSDETFDCIEHDIHEQDEHLLEIKAKLTRTLTSQAEQIKNMIPFKINAFDCYKDIKYNAKIRLKKEESPLVLNFGYQES